MLFPMKIQPVDFNTIDESATRNELVKPVAKCLLRRLFERPIPRSSASEIHLAKDGSGEFEPSSVCLAKMVQNFIEEGNDKQETQKCSRKRCKCFNRSCSDGLEEDLDSSDSFGDSNLSSSADACKVLKSLGQCASVCERNLLADTSIIIEKNKISKRKDEYCRKIVTDGLLALGYDASICQSRWEKSPFCPAGEYEYVDVLVEGERLIIDIDFRSEFEIARSTKTYKSILQTLPHIFVGRSDRLQKIISIVSEAAKQSLKKKGMHFPPWRKAEYVKAKWLSPCTRTKPTPALTSSNSADKISLESVKENLISKENNSPSELHLIFKEESSSLKSDHGDGVFVLSSEGFDEEEEKATAMAMAMAMAMKKWEPPEAGLKKPLAGVKMVTGLASVIPDKP